MKQSLVTQLLGRFGYLALSALLPLLVGCGSGSQGPGNANSLSADGAKFGKGSGDRTIRGTARFASDATAGRYLVLILQSLDISEPNILEATFFVSGSRADIPFEAVNLIPGHYRICIGLQDAPSTAPTHSGCHGGTLEVPTQRLSASTVIDVTAASVSDLSFGVATGTLTE